MSVGKWLAGILATVVAALIVWQVTDYFDRPPPETPELRVTSWATPESVELGKALEISVKVLDEQDSPVPDASVQLTPTSGSFLWAAAGTEPIRGTTNESGVYTMTFQTVLQVGVIGGDTPPANSDTGTISVRVTKVGFQDGHDELMVRATS